MKVAFGEEEGTKAQQHSLELFIALILPMHVKVCLDMYVFCDFQATGLSLAPASPKPGFQRFVSPVSCRAASRHHSGDSGENGFDGRLVHGKIPSMSGIYIGQNVLVSSGFQELIQVNSII